MKLGRSSRRRRVGSLVGDGDETGYEKECVSFTLGECESECVNFVGA